MTNGAIYYNRCGTQNSALAKFCANCGTPFSPDLQPPSSAMQMPAEITPQSQGPARQGSYAFTRPATRYGGFRIRFVAAIIDAIPIGFVTWPLSLMVGVVIGIRERRIHRESPDARFGKGLHRGGRIDPVLRLLQRIEFLDILGHHADVGGIVVRVGKAIEG